LRVPDSAEDVVLCAITPEYTTDAVSRNYRALTHTTLHIDEELE
jgi:hypothetical protein